MGEIGLSAAVAGKFGKNVTFVAGDRSAISEAMEILEDFEYVVLKEGISRYSAITYSYEDSIEMLKEAAYNATKRVGKTFRLKEPILMEIEFINTGMADYASLIPLFERVNGYRIKIKANDIIEAYKYFRAALVLASSDHGGY
ncbi:MAG: M55 family metallopeptidase [Thermoplasmata archaeon]